MHGQSQTQPGLHNHSVTQQSPPCATYCLPSHTSNFGTANHYPPLCRISQVWLNPPHAKHERLADTMLELGPTITQVKKFEDNGTFVSEYRCKLPQCLCHQRAYDLLEKDPFLDQYM
jgi:hypothetical protein